MQITTLVQWHSFTSHYGLNVARSHDANSWRRLSRVENGLLHMATTLFRTRPTSGFEAWDVPSNPLPSSEAFPSALRHYKATLVYTSDTVVFPKDSQPWPGRGTG
jgi:hypothetical protein